MINVYLEGLVDRSAIDQRVAYEKVKNDGSRALREEGPYSSSVGLGMEIYPFENVGLQAAAYYKDPGAILFTREECETIGSDLCDDRQLQSLFVFSHYAYYAGLLGRFFLPKHLPFRGFSTASFGGGLYYTKLTFRRVATRVFGRELDDLSSYSWYMTLSYTIYPQALIKHRPKTDMFRNTGIFFRIGIDVTNSKIVLPDDTEPFEGSLLINTFAAGVWF